MRDFAKRIKILAVTGPTATGKTALAVELAKEFDGEIVSVDSRQVYRGMDIGSGKDIGEYGEVPYHLIDVAQPGKEVYNLSRFCKDAYAAIDDISARGKLPVLCGGTALYLHALLQGYELPGGALAPRQPGVERVRQSGTENSFQPPFALDPLVLGVLYPRRTVRERIEKRLDARFEQGMIGEIQQLHDAAGVTWEQLEFFGLEYREIARYLQNLCTFEEMRTTLLNRIRQFAKRQDIFFRKMEREGVVIHWLKLARIPEPRTLIRDFLAGKALPPPEFRLCDFTNPPAWKQ